MALGMPGVTGMDGIMSEVSARRGVIVDLDTGTVTDTNVVFIPEDVWQEVDDDFCSGGMTDSEVIDFASENGIQLLTS